MISLKKNVFKFCLMPLVILGTGCKMISSNDTNNSSSAKSIDAADAVDAAPGDPGVLVKDCAQDSKDPQGLKGFYQLENGKFYGICENSKLDLGHYEKSSAVYDDGNDPLWNGVHNFMTLTCNGAVMVAASLSNKVRPNGTCMGFTLPTSSLETPKIYKFADFKTQNGRVWIVCPPLHYVSYVDFTANPQGLSIKAVACNTPNK